MTLIEVLKKIAGAATARRVGTDALSPTFAQLLPMAFPNAELVDARARACAQPGGSRRADEIAVLRGRTRRRRARRSRPRSRRAGAGCQRAVADRRDDGGDGRGRGQHTRHSGRRVDHSQGPLVASRFAATAASPTATWWRCRAGALAGRLCRRGRPHLAGRRRRREPTRCSGARMSCGSGWLTHAGPVRRASRSACRRTRRPASRCPPIPVAHGLGLGFDPPVISPDLPTTCCRGAAGTGHGARGHRLRVGTGCRSGVLRDAVLISDDGAEVLTSSPTYGAVEATA